MNTRAILALCLLGCACACAVGPKYQRPEVPVPDHVRGISAPNLGEAESLADRQWWELFSDEALQSLIDEALQNNFDVRTAAWRVEEFRARAGIARSELFPQIDYAAGWSRSRESAFVEPGAARPMNLHQVHLGLSWEIDLWGRIRRLSEAALARYASTDEARRGVVLSVVSEVAEAYFELLDLDARLEIARRTTDAFGATRDLFQSRLAGGMASHLEAARAEAAMRSAAASIPDLEREIAAQENLICFLVGRSPGPVRRGALLTEQYLPQQVPVGLPSALLQRRPDLRQAEQQLVASNADVGEAVASFFPRISLTGAFGGASPEVSDLFAAGKTWSIAAGLAGPLFEGLRLKNQYDTSVALFEQAKLQYESAVSNAFREVSSALVAHGKLADAEKEQSASVAAYKDAVDLANIRYRAGLSSYVEVLDAEQQLFPAENALAQARFTRLANFVELYKALGGGWPLESRQASR